MIGTTSYPVLEAPEEVCLTLCTQGLAPISSTTGNQAISQNVRCGDA